MYAKFLEDRVYSYIPFTQISYIISEIYKQRNKMNSITNSFSNPKIINTMDTYAMWYFITYAMFIQLMSSILSCLPFMKMQI